MKNLIGEALCGICQESFSTTITGTYTIILGFGELAIEVFCLFFKKKLLKSSQTGTLCVHARFLWFQDFLCVWIIKMALGFLEMFAESNWIYDLFIFISWGLAFFLFGLTFTCFLL